MYLLIKDALISDVLADLGSASEDLLVDIDSGDFFHPELYPAFEDVEVYDGDWDIESLDSFIHDYSEFLNDLLEEDGLEKANQLAISARLFVLGEDKSFDRQKVPFVLVDYLLNEEIPVAFHPWMDNLIELRGLNWPEYPQPFMTSSDLTYLYLDQDEVLDNRHYCVQLTNPSGELMYSNLQSFEPVSVLLEEGFSVWVNSEEPEQKHWFKVNAPENCLIRTLTLPDGGILMLGESMDHSYPLIQGLSQFLVLGFVCISLISLGCGYWVASRAVRKISHMNEICDRITQGELALRMPVSQSGDDYDQLAQYINSTLDKMAALLNSVKRVSDNIAHDLKTPLAHVHTQLEKLLQSRSPSHEDILAILHENERIIHCFNALLRIAEIEQGAQRQAFVSFHFSEIISTLRDLYEPAMEQKQLLLKVESPVTNSLVYGDKHQWLQVFVNLLDNAIKFSPSGGEVSIQLVQVGNQLRVTLKDSGPGIPESSQKEVFERFYRLDSHRSTPGFGLGLSMVKAVCDLHDSHIELMNDNGLVVIIYLALET